MSVRKERAARKSQPDPPAAPIAKAAAPPIDWRRHGLVAMALAVLLLAAYANSFRAGFTYDNKLILLEDPRLHAATPENISAIWSKGYWYANQDPTLYRPLTTFSYLFNYALLGNGAQPAGYHWINLLLHAANALLVYALGLVLFRKTAPAVALAAVWCVHPVLTESVTNIVGRADLLSAFGVLAGLLCHIYAASATGLRKAGYVIGLTAAAAIGFFSKESSVVLIALMLVYDVAFRKGEIKAALAGYAAALLPLAVYLSMRWQVLSTLPPPTDQFVNNPLVGAGFLVSRLSAIQVIGRYLLLLAWPYRLSCDYSYNQIPLFRGTFDNLADWATLAALVVCIAVAALAVAWYRRNKPGFFFIAVFFLALAPVANIAFLIGTIMAERLLYLPALGFAGCLVWAMWAAAEHFGDRWQGAARQVAWIVGVVVIALAVRTYVRNADWESGLTLWGSAARTVPGSYKAHLNLAVAEVALGDPFHLDNAIVEGERSLAILDGAPLGGRDVTAYPDVGAAHRLKGDLVRDAGGPDAARKSREWYEKSLAILLQGVTVERTVAEANLRANEAAGRPPAMAGYPLAYKELGQTYLRLEQPQKALDALQFGLYIQPSHELLQLISETYSALHDQGNAAIALMEGVLLFPDEKGFPSELLKLYEGLPDPNCAVEKTAGSSNVNLGCPMVHNQLCAAAAKVQDLHTRRGRSVEAEKMRLTAVQSLGCPAQ